MVVALGVSVAVLTKVDVFDGTICGVTASVTSESSSFTSSYSEPGVKVIGLVVRTSGGVIDRSIDLLDVE